jgi:hypothetical protein
VQDAARFCFMFRDKWPERNSNQVTDCLAIFGARRRCRSVVRYQAVTICVDADAGRRTDPQYWAAFTIDVLCELLRGLDELACLLEIADVGEGECALPQVQSPIKKMRSRVLRPLSVGQRVIVERGYVQC